MKLKNVLIALTFCLLSPQIALGSVIPPERVSDYANSIAMSYGVPVALLEAIIQAESNFDTQAQNSSSTASGVLQFTNPTFQAFCIDRYGLASSMAEKNSYTTQIICGAKMIKDGYLDRWSASEVKWKQLLADG